MRILYDHQAFDMQTHGGVSRCFVELMRNLPKDVVHTLAVLESDNEYLNQIGYPRIGEIYNRFIKKGEFPCKGRIFDIYYNKIKQYHYGWEENKYRSIDLLKKGSFDVFHPTFFDDYFLPYLNGKPFVLTIHDMIPELYPEYFGVNDFQIVKKRKLAPLASAIVAVSEQTKRDIIKLLEVPEEKIHVIYHGAMEDVVLERNYQMPVFGFPYILYVGDRFGYKNFFPFVKACSTLLLKDKSLKVLCTGKAFNEKEVDLLKVLGVQDQFVHFFVPDNTTFQRLYHFAKVFVYPSDYEGFGIPILEAYQADCPVLLNNTSCFPEVAGDAAVYFNGFSEDSDFCEKLNIILSMSQSERQDLLHKQKERLKMYSWQKSAVQLANIYKSL